MTKVFNHITEDEKIKLARITQDCLDTHVFNPPKAFVSLAVMDRDGNEIERHELLSKSWTRNFYNVMFSAMANADMGDGTGTFAAGGMAIKRPTAQVVAIAGANCYLFTGSGTQDHLIGLAGSNVTGIVVGTSDSAESFESYDMGAIIAAGNSSGQISYNAQSAPTYAYDSGTKKATATHRRFFNNNSGAEIIVKECGLRSSIWVNGTNYPSILINRDVLPTPVTVPNGGQLKVDYVIEMVYPA